jgi:hypothetical protein
MKHLSILRIASASLVWATAAVATGKSADLAVNGSIVPGAACTVAVGTGPLDLGNIKASELEADPSKPTKLAEQRVKTTVACPQPQRFAFVVRETGGMDPGLETAFPMRSDDEAKGAGKLFLLFDTQSAKIDGKQGFVTGANGVTDLGQASWGPATSSRENLPITNGRYAVGFVTEEASMKAPENIRDLSVYLLVRPQINPVEQLDLSQAIGFSSDLGLEITYF